MRRSFLAAAALVLAVSTASAEGLDPRHALTIGLGAVTGVAYYTVEPDGLHVIATFAHDDRDEHPLRVQAVLGAGQKLTISTARGAGVEPVRVNVARQGDRVVVETAPATD